MRAADIFSLVVAALFGLLTLIVEPWSITWWVGVIALSAIALGYIVYKVLEAHSVRRGTMLAILGTTLIVVGAVTGLVGAFMEDLREAAPTSAAKETSKPPTMFDYFESVQKN